MNITVSSESCKLTILNSRGFAYKECSLSTSDPDKLTKPQHVHFYDLCINIDELILPLQWGTAWSWPCLVVTKQPLRGVYGHVKPMPHLTSTVGGGLVDKRWSTRVLARGFETFLDWCLFRLVHWSARPASCACCDRLVEMCRVLIGSR